MASEEDILAYPPYPPLEGQLRLATAADLAQIADLSILGFKDSEIFRFERPRYNEFPHDAVVAFSNIYRTQLSDPLAVVVAVEDTGVPEENDGTTKIDHAEKVVVGVASWDLPEDSPRKGQFVVSDLGDPVPQLDRELCRRRWDLFTAFNKASEKKHDKTDTGVIPSHVGEPLYIYLGYEKIDEVRVPDDGDVEGFSRRVLLYRTTAEKKPE